MSKPREMLQEFLEGIPGVKKVYFQPPATMQMVYPCIRYTKTIPIVRYADDIRYFGKNRYDLIVIDKDPDSKIPDRILKTFTYCSIDRPYTANNLHHTAMTLFF